MVDPVRALELMDGVKTGAEYAQKGLGSPLQYEVMNPGPVYFEPIPQAMKVGEVLQGWTVWGYPGSVAWIRVTADHNDKTKIEGWIPVRSMDGPAHSRRLVLHAQWPELKVNKNLGTALEVEWPGIPAPSLTFKLTYCLEWRLSSEPGAIAGRVLSIHIKANLKDLPASTDLQLRVGARIASQETSSDIDIRLSGPWQDFKTSFKIETQLDGYKKNWDSRTIASLKAAGALPKRWLRALRGGLWGLEYRVNEAEDGGVFTSTRIEAGRPVEMCPLLEVDRSCASRSDVLKRLTLPMLHDADTRAITLGFARLYTKSKEPNLHWGYCGTDDVLLWAAEDIEAKAELTVNFAAPPQSADGAERKRPRALVDPPQQPTNAAQKFSGAGHVLHGNSGVHGRGVFVTKVIQAGQLIESCPVVMMDDGCAEALFSYRWASKGQGGGPYYLPLGHGCLYNHSEKANTCAKLDLGRRVLEFVAIEPLHVGQEVFVNYGSEYFDDDFEGHRRFLSVDIDAATAAMDFDVRMYAELVSTVLRIFSDPELQQNIRKLSDEPDPNMFPSEKELRKETWKRKDRLRQLLVDAQLPVLERFGFTRDTAGALDMGRFELEMYDDPRITPEIRAIADLRSLLLTGQVPEGST